SWVDLILTNFRTLFRASFSLPALTSTIVGGMIFRLMFSDSGSSVANQLLGVLGIDPVTWRFTAWAAIFLMVILGSWRWIGVHILYFLAVLQNIAKSLYEAEDNDGHS